MWCGAKKEESSTGLEPAISRFVGGCLIHWATKTSTTSTSPTPNHTLTQTFFDHARPTVAFYMLSPFPSTQNHTKATPATLKITRAHTHTHLHSTLCSALLLFPHIRALLTSTSSPVVQWALLRRPLAYTTNRGHRRLGCACGCLTRGWR